MEKLAFSPATEIDIPAITEVLTDATQYKLTQGDTSWGDEGWFPYEIQERMNSGSTFYLVEWGGETVGTVSLSWDDNRNWGDRPADAGYMHQLAVREGFRGKQVGEKIINWLVDEVARSERKFLRLDCDANNPGLCGYYERQGFTRVGTNTRPDNEMGSYEAALYERPVAE